MDEKRKKPSVSLGTLVMVIPLLQREINEFRKGESTCAEDDLRLFDLINAAEELRDEYTSYIEENKIINFPKYERLVGE